MPVGGLDSGLGIESDDGVVAVDFDRHLAIGILGRPVVKATFPCA